jgi:hypothetical protein
MRGDGLSLCRGVVGCVVFMAHDPLVELTFTYSYMVDVHGTYLVGGLEHALFFHSVGNVIIPIDFSIFQRD